MPLPTGKATPWRELEGPPAQGGSSTVSYIRVGHGEIGPSEALAEQLRIDGVFTSIRYALEAAAATTPELTWFGIDDNGQETTCDSEGWMTNGNLALDPTPCVLAVVNRVEA